MAVFTTSTFWVIVGIIIVLLALIGYLAEGTDIIKTKKTAKKETQNSEETAEENMHTPVIIGGSKLPIGVSVVRSDGPIEILNVKDTLWSDDFKMPDPTQTTIHDVPSMDDWSSMPEIIPPQNNENNVEETNDDEEMFPDITMDDFENKEENEDQSSGIWN